MYAALENNELLLSYSSMSSFNSCPRKFEFRKLYLHPGKDESIPADTGNALHAGYQTFMATDDKDAGVFAMMQKYPIHLCSDPNHPWSMEAAYATLQAMMASPNLLEFELADVECLDGITRPGTEVKFEIIIKNFSLSDMEQITVKFIGFIDLLFYNSLTGEYIVVDIKTNRRNLQDMTAVYRFDEQQMPYGIILERMLGNPIEALTVKYLNAFVDIANPKIHMYTYEKAQDEVKDWARGLLVDLQRLKIFYNMGWFPRKGNSCLAYNRQCTFFDVCASRDHETIQQIILMNQQPYINRGDEKPWVSIELELAA